MGTRLAEAVFPDAGDRPRVVFLTQVLPYPLDSGPKVRAYHVLRWLAERADVVLVSFVRGDDSQAAIEHLRSICAEVRTVPIRRSKARDAWHLLYSTVAGQSFIVRRDYSHAMQREVARATDDARVCAVHADQLWMAQYARQARAPYRVLDNHNAVYMVFQRLAANEPSALRRRLLYREASRLSRYEAAQVTAFDRVLFVSAEDMAAVRRIAGERVRRLMNARCSVLPISIDVSRHEVVTTRSHPNRLTVLGTMYWPPNAEGVRWFVRDVFPSVLEQHSDAVLTVIGKNPPSDIARLGGRLGSAVDVTGYVSDIQPYLAQTAAFIVPLLSGGGMRVKILDAWAWGLPVLSTAVGAEGIAARSGRDILIADTPEAFARCAVRLLREPQLRAALSVGGRETVERSYDVRYVYHALNGIYGSIVL